MKMKNIKTYLLMAAVAYQHLLLVWTSIPRCHGAV